MATKQDYLLEFRPSQSTRSGAPMQKTTAIQTEF